MTLTTIYYIFYANTIQSQVIFKDMHHSSGKKCVDDNLVHQKIQHSSIYLLRISWTSCPHDYICKLKIYQGHVWGKKKKTFTQNLEQLILYVQYDLILNGEQVSLFGVNLFV